MHTLIDRLKIFLKKSYEYYLTRITRFETGMLLVSLLVAGGIWGFIELADDVFEGDIQHIDEWIMLSLRNPENLSDPLGPVWFETTMRDITAFGSVVFLAFVSLAVVGFLLLKKKKGMALFTMAAVSGGLLLSTILKYSFNRPRPDLVPHGTYVMTSSFPSGHSMLSAVVFLTLGGLIARYTKQKQLKMYVLTLSILATLLVGCSRVYLGVHWPTDVLAGWTAGASWALLCWVCAFLLQRRGRVEESIEK
jgi:undecaprenyl-diphosphatase